MSLTRSQFEEELEKLRNNLLAMGSEADRAVAESMRALVERDATIAESVIVADDRIEHTQEAKIRAGEIHALPMWKLAV